MSTKKSTAIGLGMQKLYKVSRNKIVEYRSDYYVDAKTKEEADQIWENWNLQRMKNPASAIDDKIHMFYSEDFNHGYDYDDTNYGGIEEIKYDAKNDQHRDLLKMIDPEEA